MKIKQCFFLFNVITIIITLFLNSCNTSNEVANSKTIEKRKYTKGYFVKTIAKNDQITGKNEITNKSDKQHEKPKYYKKTKNTILNNLVKEYIGDYSFKNENKEEATSLIASNSESTSEIIIKKAKTYIQLKNKTTNNDNSINYDINNNEGCDQIILKNGDTLLVDIIGVAVNVIQYLMCDSLEPVHNISKNEVLAIKYDNKQGIFYNNETYGPDNTNNFGYISSVDKTYSSGTNKKTEPGSVVSFILSIIGAVIALALPGSLFWIIGAGIALTALICGIISLAKIKKNKDEYKGAGLAIAAIVIALIVDVLVILGFLALSILF